MAFTPQNFVNQVGPAISAAFANTLDYLANSVFGGATTNPAARTALTADLPLEIVNGGTSARTAAGALTALGAVSSASLTQAALGAIFYPATAAEIALSVTPTNYYYPADPYVDPRRYGADPTGIADSTVAVQTAMNVAYQGAGGLVWIGENCNFSCNSLTLNMTSTLSHKGFRMVGSSPNGSCLTWRGSSSYFLSFVGAGTPTAEPLILENFTIIAPGVNTSTGLYLSNIAYFDIKNVYIYAFLVNLELASSLSGTVRGGAFTSGGTGIFCATGSGSGDNIVRIQDALISGNSGWGVSYDGGAMLLLEGCDMEANGTHLTYTSGGIYIGPNINSSIGYATIVIEKCWMESNLGSTILIAAPASGESFVAIRDTLTLSEDAGHAITATAGTLTIENSWSTTSNATWNLTASYLKLDNIICYTLTDNSTDSVYINAQSSAAATPFKAPTAVLGTVRSGKSSQTCITATPTTLFTATVAVQGMYTVYAYIVSGGSNYVATGRFAYDGTNLVRMGGENGSLLTLTVSGTSVQATQSSGSTQSVVYIYELVA